MRRLTIAILALLALTAVATGCEEGTTAADPSQQRKNSVKARGETFARAESKHPLPRTENFPLRRMLVEMTKREDLLNHPWYVYHMGQDGNVVGYYVAKTSPINACNFLSTTQSFEDVPGDGDDVPDFEVQAPSIDGVYYGASACNTYVWEDYTTNAIVKVTLAGGTIVTVDKPLNIEAEAIKVDRG